MQKWEYKVIFTSGVSSTEAELNDLGDDGWELVSATESRLYLKRPY